VKEIRASSKASLLYRFQSLLSSLKERLPTYINLFCFVLRLVCEAEANPIYYTSATKSDSAPPSLVSDWGESLMFDRDYHLASSDQKKKSVEQEEFEVELATLDAVDAGSTGDGSPEPGAHRAGMWACLPPGSTLEDWGVTFTFLSGLIRGWRDKIRGNVDPRTHQQPSPRAREPRAGRSHGRS
jgi:hypothetical protein